MESNKQYRWCGIREGLRTLPRYDEKSECASESTRELADLV